MLRWLKVSPLLAVIAGTPSLARAGDLDDMRSETSGSSDDSSWSLFGGDDDDGYDDDDYDYDGTGASCSGDCVGLGDLVAKRRYAPFPYARGYRGQMRIVADGESAPRSRMFSGSVALDGAWFSPTLVRSGVDLQLVGRAVGLAVDFNPMLEIRPLDALTLGSANALMVPLLRPRVRLLVGLGVNFMIDGRAHPSVERTDAMGSNATVRLAVYPVRPLVLRSRLDVGTLGDAWTYSFRATGGVMLRRFEVFGGYEARAVGRVELHGPTGGLRVFF